MKLQVKMKMSPLGCTNGKAVVRFTHLRIWRSIFGVTCRTETDTCNNFNKLKLSKTSMASNKHSKLKCACECTAAAADAALSLLCSPPLFALQQVERNTPHTEAQT